MHLRRNKRIGSSPSQKKHGIKVPEDVRRDKIAASDFIDKYKSLPTIKAIMWANTLAVRNNLTIPKKTMEDEK